MCYKKIIVFIKYEKIVVLFILNGWIYLFFYVRLVIKEIFVGFYFLFFNNEDINRIILVRVSLD